MHVIIAHEQADFDALGAMLGAYLLNKQAIPILPRRLNLNVRNFLTLYGTELPFVDRHNLPKEPIRSVTLVDTQSLYSLKGMTPKTKINVLDHHSLRPDLPETWKVTIEQLGACTTLFVEDLRKTSNKLNVIQATLLLIGIYEDTGSLSFVSTTPRDIKAVVYLMEQGANLQIAGKHLNPPLSSEQRKVYDRLLTSAKDHNIQGQKIIIACTDAMEMSDEISSIAHKLCDLLDPDALFIFVKTAEGIRLVARSTTDRVNVAEIASHFGGGGHDRAAAALIYPDPTDDQKNNSLDIITQELLQVLTKLIQPPITIKQIMSRRPLVLSPNKSAQEAAQLIQRYGYEGYPVVDNGKVIGLLTRHAVDRALAHKLNLSIGSLMEAGEVHVRPHDSVTYLQRVIASTGWGQVPVIDPTDGEVIGIVTRTDLLKTMAGNRNHLPGRQNLAPDLEAALPPARLALLKLIAEQAYNQQTAIYIVGGFVRDLLLDRPSLDFDIVVEGNAIKLNRSLADQFGGRVISHRHFGTAKWLINKIRDRLVEQLPASNSLIPGDLPDSLDFISARIEFYDYPTALPTIERSSIKLDLHRRDFTINTLALRLDGHHYGELYDYWNGLGDLNQGLVRVLHSLSFVDDPTRMLRAVRFEQRFNFQIESRTLQLMTEAGPMLRQVSGQRLRHELDLILSEDNPDSMLSRLEELDLLRPIHPDLTWRDTLSKPFIKVLQEAPDPLWNLPQQYGNSPIRCVLGYLVWLSQLSSESLHSISDRLQFPSSLKSALQATNQLLKELPSMVDSRPSQVVARLEPESLISLYAVEQLNPTRKVRHLLHRYITEWRHIQPATDGNKLQAMKIKTGPIYSDILTALRNAWLDGDIHSQQEEEALLHRLLQNLSDQE